MRRVGIVTVGRSDYGIYRPLIRRIQVHSDLAVQLFVSGAHLSRELGHTVQQIEEDGLRIDARVEMLLSSDTPEAVAKSIGLGVVGFAQALTRDRPDILVVLGDRFEMFAAAIATVPLALPLAHIHGGELTLGAMDESMRHSITKLSHLHFVSTPEYGRRVEQLGEEPGRVHVCGALGLDGILQAEPMPRAEIERRFGVRLPDGFCLVTYHPATRETEPPEVQFEELLTALTAVDRPLVFTMPNADPGRASLRDRIRTFCAERADASYVENFGTRAYFSLLGLASAMVGNSSSGIIEAASFELPVVDIGSRQEGRIRGRNVLHAECSRAAILEAVRHALDPAFRATLSGLENPYGSGDAAEKIVDVLATAPLEGLLRKRFHDLPSATGPARSSR